MLTVSIRLTHKSLTKTLHFQTFILTLQLLIIQILRTNNRLKFRLLRRYRKIMGDSRLTATGDRGHHSTCNYHAEKLLSYNSLYLLLAPSIYRASEACES